jgi:2-amino-4-hydroxy-6-hydroxymethyldihydropteridine diphosphokinase
MPNCLIGLGANLGRREQNLERAVAQLAGHAHVQLLAQSPWRTSTPVGGPAGQERYLNGAALVATSLAPQALLAVLQSIERQLGRQTTERWGPRTIDLDLLLYDEQVLRTPELVVPHPRMAWRRFVLEPAAEIAPAMVHPTIGWSLARLLEHLNTAANYVAVAGPIGVGKTQLAQALAQRRTVRLIDEELDLPGLEAFYHDPAGRAWQIELQFLAARVRLLATDAPVWSRGESPVVSDFWFDQSLAFAGVWLAPLQREAFGREVETARGRVVRPKLIVLLDAPPEELHRRVQGRGRPGEQRLTVQQLGRIREAIRARAALPDQGPILRLTNDDFDLVLTEVLAAVDAMQ